jgi:predicted CXXCH cytochrome family protein
VKLLPIRAALLFCLSAFGLFAQDVVLEVLTPVENTLQSELTLNIVLKLDKKSVDSIKIIAPSEHISLEIDNKKETECKNISLRLGENRVAIQAYKNGVLVDEKIRDVYVSSELYHQFRYPPQKYAKNYFHNEANEKVCSKCHDMSVNELNGVAFEDITKSNCYGCHKNINKEKYAHAPSANWLCTSCHKESKKGVSKYLTKEPVDFSCFECHKENEELWSSAKYRHEPLDSGHCSKCHNPHSGPYSMFIRKDVNEICLGCHKDKHIKASQSKKTACAGISHGGLCIECHTPHASNRPFFLKKGFDEVKK